MSDLLKANGLGNDPLIKSSIAKAEKDQATPIAYNAYNRPMTEQEKRYAASLVEASKPLGKIIDKKCPEILTRDPATQATINLCKRLSSYEHTILLHGETGTGKELLARTLHGERTGEFIPVNCGGFPEHIVDSILFGHSKGSFTGAEKDRCGLFEAAKDGTIFLDEVSRLPLHMQPKLLRVLQEKEVMRIGESSTRNVNCRVVVATNQCLRELAENGKFQDDLYWRLSTIVVETIPLRERRDDIYLYIEQRMKKGLTLTDDDKAYIEMNEWRGNYRELQQWLIRKELGI